MYSFSSIALADVPLRVPEDADVTLWLNPVMLCSSLEFLRGALHAWRNTLTYAAECCTGIYMLLHVGIMENAPVRSENILCM